MRIAYGVMGYGRGHASRVRAVLPSLVREHDVTVFAGGDAYDMLAPDYDTVRIPMLGYAYGRAGHASFSATLGANARLTSELVLGGASVQALMQDFRARGVEIAISDSEAWTHQAARRLLIPRISFDHVGIIAWCAPHFPAELAWRGRRDGWGYRKLMGQPERVLISSFYPAVPLAASTRVVGPILRPEVLAQPASAGDYLLAYFNRGNLQYTPRIEQALTNLDLPVVVYGTPFAAARENLDFRPIHPTAFLRDLAGCRAVIATAGNQLIGEALHFRKPVLALPERVFEQQLNAWIVDRLGIGRAGTLADLSTDAIELFLADSAACAARMADMAGDGREAAIATLRQFIEELRPAARAPVPPPAALTQSIASVRQPGNG